ncbi:hypothetical protein, partial [Dialister succinatiphilus]|uniref:hypothetical protein n=1 Tax=Dialister succinatiphilus TaxID=487173 RepID=UPI00235504D6
LCEAVRIVLYTHRPQGEASKPSTQPAAPAAPLHLLNPLNLLNLLNLHTAGVSSHDGAYDSGGAF